MLLFSQSIWLLQLCDYPYYLSSGGEPERACIADLMFVLAHKPWITAGFVTVCCSMSMVSKNFMHPLLRLTKLPRYTHASTKLHKLS